MMAIQTWGSRFIRAFGPWKLKQIDFLLISLNFAIGLSVFIFPYQNFPFTDNQHYLLLIVVGNCLFYGLSWLTPSMNTRLWKRRLYVVTSLSCVTFFTLFPPFQDQFILVFYWWILKGYLLLPFHEILVMILVMGGIYVNVSMLGVETSLQHAMEQCSRYNLPSDYLCMKVDRPGYLFNNTIFFTGFSIFALLGGRLLKSEQASRQRSETLSREIESLTQTLERDRMARDINDAMGYQLSMMGEKIRLAQRLHDQDFQGTQQAIADATKLNHDCQRTLRQKLVSFQQDPINFAQSVQVLLQQIQQRQEIDTTSRIEFPPLPPQMNYQLYCIVQEALANIQQHANASLIRIVAWKTKDSLWLEIQDNGVGFNPDQPTVGFGLQGIQERVLILGGRLALKTQPNHGTVLTIMIPAQGQ